ncbi:MAG: hypothetical protein WCF90_11240 [Methanomicrobiales archaeon]
MLANVEELAGIEYNGMKAIHQLFDACDKKIRPTLIREMGKCLRSQIYYRRGIPTNFHFFSLVDICGDYRDSIAGIFSNDRL